MKRVRSDLYHLDLYKLKYKRKEDVGEMFNFFLERYEDVIDLLLRSMNDDISDDQKALCSVIANKLVQGLESIDDILYDPHGYIPSHKQAILDAVTHLYVYSSINNKKINEDKKIS